MDANSLIQAILKAFTIDDGEEDIPIGVTKHSDPLDDKSYDESLIATQGTSGTQNCAQEPS